MTDSYRYIQTQLDGHILTITMNRPEVRNALNPEAHAELARAFDDFADDHDLWVAILTGTGDKAFCAGTDLKARAVSGRDDHPATGYGGLCLRFDLYKPVIAAINGLAVGGGLELMLACDLAIASDHAWFSLPETRVGLAASGGGGIHRLVRQIPEKKAMEMILTGCRVNAHEALDVGLVNRVVPGDELMTSAMETAKAITACAPLATQASKQLAIQGLSASGLKEAIVAEYSLLNTALNSEDAIEGQRAFVEKRDPDWKNR